MRELNKEQIPKPADKIVERLIKTIDLRIPGLLSGFYILGSIPLGDFYDSKSDIDFIANCNFLPSDEEFEKLRKIHYELSKEFPKPDLSGTYMILESIEGTNFKNIPVVNYHEGNIKFDVFEMAPITLAEFKRYSLTLFGKLPREFNFNIDRQMMNEFMHENINSYWLNWYNEHKSITKRWLLLFLFPRFTEWSILGIARQIYTLNKGNIASKKNAGQYILTELPIAFHQIVIEALLIREDNRSYPFVRSYAIRPSFKRTRVTLRCMAYMINKFNTSYKLICK